MAGQTQVSTRLKVYREFDVTNRLEGTAAFFTIALSNVGWRIATTSDSGQAHGDKVASRPNCRFLLIPQFLDEIFFSVALNDGYQDCCSRGKRAENGRRHIRPAATCIPDNVGGRGELSGCNDEGPNGQN